MFSVLLFPFLASFSRGPAFYAPARLRIAPVDPCFHFLPFLHTRHHTLTAGKHTQRMSAPLILGWPARSNAQEQRSMIHVRWGHKVTCPCTLSPIPCSSDTRHPMLLLVWVVDSNASLHRLLALSRRDVLVAGDLASSHTDDKSTEKRYTPGRRNERTIYPRLDDPVKITSHDAIPTRPVRTPIASRVCHV